MDINAAIGGGQDMTLSGAVLVYQGGREAFAVWHPAKSVPTEGAPYLGEAEPLTMEFLRALSTGLGVYVAPEVLPSSVLVRTSELRELSVSLRSHDWEVKTQVGRGGYSTPACR